MPLPKNIRSAVDLPLMKQSTWTYALLNNSHTLKKARTRGLLLCLDTHYHYNAIRRLFRGQDKDSLVTGSFSGSGLSNKCSPHQIKNEGYISSKDTSIAHWGMQVLLPVRSSWEQAGQRALTREYFYSRLEKALKTTMQPSSLRVLLYTWFCI